MSTTNIIVEGAEEINGMVTATVLSDGSVVFTPGEDAGEAPAVAGGGILGGFEVISVRQPPDLSVGHHILTANSGPPNTTFDIPVGTNDKEFHTFFSAKASDPTGSCWVKITRLDPATGVVQANQLVALGPATMMGAQWDEAAGAWIIKITTPADAVTLVSDLRSELFESNTSSQGSAMVGVGPASTPFFGGWNRLDEAMKYVGLQGMLFYNQNVSPIGNGSTSRSITDGTTQLAQIGVTNSDVTLSVAGMTTGQIIQIVRVELEASTLDVINGGPGAGTMFQFPASTACMAVFRFDGTDLELLHFALINPYSP